MPMPLIRATGHAKPDHPTTTANSTTLSAADESWTTQPLRIHIRPSGSTAPTTTATTKGQADSPGITSRPRRLRRTASKGVVLDDSEPATTMTTARPIVPPPPPPLGKQKSTRQSTRGSTAVAVEEERRTVVEGATTGTKIPGQEEEEEEGESTAAGATTKRKRETPPTETPCSGNPGQSNGVNNDNGGGGIHHHHNTRTKKRRQQAAAALSQEVVAETKALTTTTKKKKKGVHFAEPPNCSETAPTTTTTTTTSRKRKRRILSRTSNEEEVDQAQQPLHPHNPSANSNNTTTDSLPLDAQYGMEAKENEIDDDSDDHGYNDDDIALLQRHAMFDWSAMGLGTRTGSGAWNALLQNQAIHRRRGLSSNSDNNNSNNNNSNNNNGGLDIDESSGSSIPQLSSMECLHRMQQLFHPSIPIILPPSDSFLRQATTMTATTPPKQAPMATATGSSSSSSSSSSSTGTKVISEDHLDNSLLESNPHQQPTLDADEKRKSSGTDLCNPPTTLASTTPVTGVASTTTAAPTDDAFSSSARQQLLELYRDVMVQQEVDPGYALRWTLRLTDVDALGRRMQSLEEAHGRLNVRERELRQKLLLQVGPK
ncbi:hypothetical protein ACA910_004569 [Epithemia clementina (nom. ined.)]